MEEPTVSFHLASCQTGEVPIQAAPFVRAACDVAGGHRRCFAGSEHRLVPDVEAPVHEILAPRLGPGPHTQRDLGEYSSALDTGEKQKLTIFPAGSP